MPVGRAAITTDLMSSRVRSRPSARTSKRFLAVADATGAVVAIVSGERAVEHGHRNPARRHRWRRWHDLEGAHEAPEHIDVGDARQASQGGANGPVDQAALFGGRRDRRRQS